MRTFNAKRGASSLVGLMMVAIGAVWILQGLNLAFRVGFMVGDPRWVLFGSILALAGIAVIVWSNLRRSPESKQEPGAPPR
jgi:hypothetical protein